MRRAILLALFLTGCDPRDQKLNEYEAAIQSFSEQSEAVDQEIAALENEIAELQTTIESFRDGSDWRYVVPKVEEHTAALSLQLDSLKTSHEELDSSIAAANPLPDHD